MPLLSIVKFFDSKGNPQELPISSLPNGNFMEYLKVYEFTLQI